MSLFVLGLLHNEKMNLFVLGLLHHGLEHFADLLGTDGERVRPDDPRDPVLGLAHVQPQERG
jgi:hypothetical protein